MSQAENAGVSVVDEKDGSPRSDAAHSDHSVLRRKKLRRSRAERQGSLLHREMHEDMDLEFKGLPVSDVEDKVPAVQWAMTLNVFKDPMDPESGRTPLPEEVLLADGPYKAKLLIYQKEVGNIHGYVHYQVALALEKKCRFTNLRAVLVAAGYKPWLRKVAGKTQWNKWKSYCKKRDKPGVDLDVPAFIFGDDALQGQGKKKESDMQLAIEYVKNNGAVTAKEFLEVFPNLHRSGNQNVLDYLRKTLFPKHERKEALVMVFYGPTGMYLLLYTLFIPVQELGRH